MSTTRGSATRGDAEHGMQAGRTTRLVRTSAAVGGIATLLVAGLAGPAQAEGHYGPPPPHGHMLVLGVEYRGGEPVGFRKCVDLAAGRPLRLNAHHAHSHTGAAGQALRNAGHLVIPTAPLTPLTCELLRAMFSD
jgi:hypothetical protein